MYMAITLSRFSKSCSIWNKFNWFCKNTSTQNIETTNDSGTTQFDQSRKMTLCGQTICKIASQMNSSRWEHIIFKSPRNDEMMEGWQRIGVGIDFNKLRIINTKIEKNIIDWCDSANN
jgi:hypothetical protein